MVRLGERDEEGGRAAGVSAALRRLHREVQGFGWQLLVVGSGLWREAAGCVERFVVDAAEALEQRSPRSTQGGGGRWGNRTMHGVGGRLVRAVHWCELRARACRRLAVRIDDALLARRDRPDGSAGPAGI
jgi:hypothetical protein